MIRQVKTADSDIFYVFRGLEDNSVLTITRQNETFWDFFLLSDFGGSKVESHNTVCVAFREPWSKSKTNVSRWLNHGAGLVNEGEVNQRLGCPHKNQIKNKNSSLAFSSVIYSTNCIT